MWSNSSHRADFSSFLRFHELIEPPLLASPNVIVVALRTIDQLMPVQVRQAIRVSSVVPVVVTALCAIDSQPAKCGIDDLLVEKRDQRRHTGYLATGRMLLERGLHFEVCCA